jgi:hypothetical protein
MMLRNKWCFVLLSITAAALTAAAQSTKDAPAFRPGPAGGYPSRQVTGKLTLAAVKYESDGETRAPFGKLNPNEYGVLPVLLVLENKGDQTLLLDRMRVAYQAPDRTNLNPTPAEELPFLKGVKRPNLGPRYPSPIPLPKRNKNPLAAAELDTRSFAARTLLPGETAHGFFYFQTRYQRNAVIYVTGIREGVSNKEVFYAEIPLDSPTQP